MTLEAVSDSTPPPDLTVSLTLSGGKLLEPITLERKAERSSFFSTSYSPTSTTQTNHQEGMYCMSFTVEREHTYMLSTIS